MYVFMSPADGVKTFARFSSLGKERHLSGTHLRIWKLRNGKMVSSFIWTFGCLSKVRGEQIDWCHARGFQVLERTRSKDKPLLTTESHIANLRPLTWKYIVRHLFLLEVKTSYTPF